MSDEQTGARIAQLEALLNSEDDTPIRITPDGRVVPLTADPDAPPPTPKLTPEVIAVANAIRDQWFERAGDWLAIARAAIAAVDTHRQVASHA